MPIHGYPGNVVTANPTSPTADSASGVWTLEQQLQAQAAGNWPQIPIQVSQSIRFNSADSAYLSRTPGSAGNRTTWTWSGWVKRSALSSNQAVFSASDGTESNEFLVYFGTGNTLTIQQTVGGTASGQVSCTTNAVYRDTSAWYHIVLAVDTTQATSTNRLFLYVNGVSQTFSSYSVGSSINTWVNNTNAHAIGKRADASLYFNGYLAEINFVDGQALTPTSFGEFNATTGVWQPKKYSGTYGTNGFYLPMNEAYEGFNADFLVIAGGGGGGGSSGGGGGAGGYRTSAGTSGGGASAESALSLAVGVAYTVTVGSGGSGNTTFPGKGSNGNNSVFSTITSTGGGGGSGSGLGDGNSGGSGGGGADSTNGGAGTTGQGFAGGNNQGGGGGAGEAGNTDGAGQGGDGVASSITGSSVTRGGGGASASGSGGDGGGGNQGASGAANTGGGGGRDVVGSPPSGGAGGSGVVIIKIPDTRTATFSGGVTSSLSTAVSGYKIYTVTATSTTSETVTFS